MDANIINGNIISSYEDGMIINNKKIPFKKGMTGNNVSMINGSVYIDGYELVGDNWKRTIKAIWYMIF